MGKKAHTTLEHVVGYPQTSSVTNSSSDSTVMIDVTVAPNDDPVNKLSMMPDIMWNILQEEGVNILSDDDDDDNNDDISLFDDSQNWNPTMDVSLYNNQVSHDKVKPIFHDAVEDIFYDAVETFSDDDVDDMDDPSEHVSHNDSLPSFFGMLEPFFLCDEDCCLYLQHKNIQSSLSHGDILGE